MATGNENTPIHVALIVFVLLTIALSVTSFMFYKEYEESDVNRVAAEEKFKISDDEKKEKETQLGRLMELVGVVAANGPATGDQVETIMVKFDRDKAKFTDTYEGSDAKVYPEIVGYQLDQFIKLQDGLADLRLQIAKLKDDHAQELVVANKKIKETDEAFKAQAADIRGVEDKYSAEHAKLLTQLAQHKVQIADGQKELLDMRDKAKKRETQLAEQVVEKVGQLRVAIRELEDTKERPGAAPDGLIVGVGTQQRSVYINLGYADGLRKQTVFRVFPFDALNIENATPKGAIEVVRIVSDHLSVARVTEDRMTDPIVRDDKIYSVVFRPGRPEGFAIAGLVDIDGDNRSDMTQLLSLIQTNRGRVDVYVDDQGKTHGAMSPATKYLIIGQRPTENTDPKRLKTYDRLVDDATKFGVSTIDLSDFLDYMGYQGSERSIGLGGRAKSSDYKTRRPRHGGDAPFRRRSATNR